MSNIPATDAEILNWVLVAKGEHDGHPFRGNQHTTGQMGTETATESHGRYPAGVDTTGKITDRSQMVAIDKEIYQKYISFAKAKDDAFYAQKQLQLKLIPKNSTIGGKDHNDLARAFMLNGEQQSANPENLRELFNRGLLTGNTQYAGNPKLAFENYDKKMENFQTAKTEYSQANSQYQGWNRFYAVAGGHIHEDMNCHSCNNGATPTKFVWLPELSGQSAGEAVAQHGATLCSHCFPDAPVEQTNATLPANFNGVRTVVVTEANGHQLEQGADLKGVDLSNQEMTNAKLQKSDFTDAKLSGSNLTGAKVTGAKFVNADLSGANLNNLYGTKAKFTDANLSKADLSGATLDNAIFKNTDLTDITAKGTSFFGVTFTNCDLSNANFSGEGRSLFGAGFKNSNLSGADLSGANIEANKVSNTDLTGANITGADFKGYSNGEPFVGCTGLDQVVGEPARLSYDNTKFALPDGWNWAEGKGIYKVGA